MPSIGACRGGVNGIETIALMNRYVGQRMGQPKTKMIITEPYQRELWDHTLSGGMRYNEEDPETKKFLTFEDYFDVVRPRWKPNQVRETWEVTFQDIHLELFRTQHIPDSAKDWENSFISYGVYFPDEQIFVSVDTRFDADLLDLYDGKSRVMFHDVQFFPGGVHAPLENLRTRPETMRQKMFLMHYGDNYDQQDISDFAGWVLPGHRYIFS